MKAKASNNVNKKKAERKASSSHFQGLKNKDWKKKEHTKVQKKAGILKSQER